MAAFGLRVVKETWEPSLADRVIFEQYNGRQLLYHRMYILCQIKNVLIVKHATLLATGTRFMHWSIWSDPSQAILANTRALTPSKSCHTGKLWN